MHEISTSIVSDRSCLNSLNSFFFPVRRSEMFTFDAAFKSELTRSFLPRSSLNFLNTVLPDLAASALKASIIVSLACVVNEAIAASCTHLICLLSRRWYLSEISDICVIIFPITGAYFFWSFMSLIASIAIPLASFIASPSSILCSRLFAIAALSDFIVAFSGVFCASFWSVSIWRVIESFADSIYLANCFRVRCGFSVLNFVILFCNSFVRSSFVPAGMSFAISVPIFSVIFVSCSCSSGVSCIS